MSYTIPYCPLPEGKLELEPEPKPKPGPVIFDPIYIPSMRIDEVYHVKKYKIEANENGSSLTLKIKIYEHNKPKLLVSTVLYFNLVRNIGNAWISSHEQQQDVWVSKFKKLLVKKLKEEMEFTRPGLYTYKLRVVKRGKWKIDVFLTR